MDFTPSPSLPVMCQCRVMIWILNYHPIFLHPKVQFSKLKLPFPFFKNICNNSCHLEKENKSKDRVEFNMTTIYKMFLVQKGRVVALLLARTQSTHFISHFSKS